MLQVRPQPALRRPVAPATPDLRALPRIVIEAVAPSVDAGRFPARAVTGDSVAVEADIFMDGHDLLRARVLWRPEGDTTWRHAAMQPIGNSRWRGYIAPDRVGPWVFTIEAWRDDFGTYARDLARRRAAGVMDTADIADGRALLEHTMHAAPAPVARELAPLWTTWPRWTMTGRPNYCLPPPPPPWWNRRTSGHSMPRWPPRCAYGWTAGRRALATGMNSFPARLAQHPARMARCTT
ncbi:DUF3416 domain-containing protein [Komagataeibacter rhaeticus]|nr:DUF3416 domain-containing protein [Komagataeibacter rhaeticus]